MLFTDSLKTAISGLFVHKSRSALTILGIFIGISAIMLIASIGDSSEKIIVGELGGLGAETIVVRPGKEPSGPTDIADVLLSDSLKERELEAITNKNNVPDVVRATPEVVVSGSVSYEGETFKPGFILGLSAEFMIDTLNLKLREGVPFDDRAIRSKSRVTVIGSRVSEELFGDRSAVGRHIQIKGNKFRVVGVFEQEGQVVFFNVDELVLVPYTSAQTYLTGTKHYNQIILTASSPEVVDRVVFDVKNTLRELHRIDNPDQDDFSVQTQQGLVEQVGTIIGIFTIFLSLVVAIALVVGGIGIMNIMLVSVTERTREIGLRKALGATNKDIMTQFLLEAILLTLFGGILGILFGFILSLGASFVISAYLGTVVTFSFPIFAAMLGIGSSALIGLVFGLYPAYQAAKKSPMEALRYE